MRAEKGRHCRRMGPRWFWLCLLHHLAQLGSEIPAASPLWAEAQRTAILLITGISHWCRSGCSLRAALCHGGSACCSEKLFPFFPTCTSICLCSRSTPLCCLVLIVMLASCSHSLFPPWVLEFRHTPPSKAVQDPGTSSLSFSLSLSHTHTHTQAPFLSGHSEWGWWVGGGWGNRAWCPSAPSLLWFSSVRIT